jgi:hypothetical protein
MHLYVTHASSLSCIANPNSAQEGCVSRGRRYARVTVQQGTPFFGALVLFPYFCDQLSNVVVSVITASGAFCVVGSYRSIPTGLCHPHTRRLETIAIFVDTSVYSYMYEVLVR